VGGAMMRRIIAFVMECATRVCGRRFGLGRRDP
jgi:hypothetical protein